MDTYAQKQLHWQGLSLRRGGRLLFDRLDGQLAAGEMVHLTGPNGAGKTSFLRIVAGLAVADAGQVRLDDQRWPDRETGVPLCWLGHATGLLPTLSGRQNLQLAARITALQNRAAPDWPTQKDDLFAITSFIDQPVRQLSQGQLRRLALSRLLLSEPRAIWLLDEPDTALDAASRTALDQLLTRHCARGGRLIITRHAPPADFAPNRVLTLRGAG